MGYGNPDGRYWFVGMEEHLDRDRDLESDIRVRTTWGDVEDLHRAHQSFEPPIRTKRHVQTWRIMSKVVLNLSGDGDWKDRERARRYQFEELGIAGGETFLTEVLPLPAIDSKSWPYDGHFLSRGEYEHETRPRRIDRIQEMVAKHRPEYLICYGTGNWTYLEQLTSGELIRAPEGPFMSTNDGSTRVALTPFFKHYEMTNAVIEGLCNHLRSI